jgi:heme/copper-type cytochrome/quinol oxidase subunit 1
VVRNHALNRAQRIVIVVGLGVALLALGEWLTALGSNLPYGWVAYAPLSGQFGPDGLHPWVRLIIWLVLITVWVLLSLRLLGTETSDLNDHD